MQIEDSRCTNFLRDFISILGGQYLVYHNGDVVSSEWCKRWNKQIVKGKKFYIVGSGNDGDYNDELLIEIEEILDWFTQNQIDQDKVIFMTSNLNLSYGLSNLKDVVKRDGIRLIEKWDYVIKQFDTKDVSNIKFCPYIYNVGDHPLNYSKITQYESLQGTDEIKEKLFSATMWTARVSNDILHQALYDSNLIKDMYHIHEDDVGFVSYGLRGRFFWEDKKVKNPPTIRPHTNLDKDEWVGDWKQGGDDVIVKYIAKSFINLIIESNCDYTVENESQYFFKGTQQYYRSRLTSSYITEKTIFPMLLKRPFLIWGGYGCLDALKELGFKTFDRIFDESYQYERDVHKRVDMILKQLEELSKKSKYDLVELYKSVEDILEHNQQLLIQNYQNQELNIGRYIYTQLKELNLC
tara:strand:+ start:4575 stop:5801 length:1227 start_codon:yes stop_codon:yes gene_type:complete